MKLLKLISPALPVLLAGLAQAQNIERVVVEDGQLKLQVRAPSISIEELHNNGAFLPVEGTDPVEQLIEIAVSAENPNRFVRARFNLNGQDFVTGARPLIEPGLIPDHQTLRPQDISLNGDTLSIEYPVERQAVVWPD